MTLCALWDELLLLNPVLSDVLESYKLSFEECPPPLQFQDVSTFQLGTV